MTTGVHEFRGFLGPYLKDCCIVFSNRHAFIYRNVLDSSVEGVRREIHVMRSEPNENCILEISDF